MPDATESRLAEIRRDLTYYTKALATMGGGQPPAVYAAKYVEDVTLLLSLLAAAPKVLEVPKTELEVALELDAITRTERRKDR
jgi:hypothetical protein